MGGWNGDPKSQANEEESPGRLLSYSLILIGFINTVINR